MKKKLLLLILAVFALGELQASETAYVDKAQAEAEKERANYWNIWENLKLYGNRAGHTVANIFRRDIFRGEASALATDLGFLEDHFYKKNFMHAFGELETRLKKIREAIEAHEKKSISVKRGVITTISKGDIKKLHELEVIVRVIAHLLNLDKLGAFEAKDTSEDKHLKIINTIETAINGALEFDSAKFNKELVSKRKVELRKEIGKAREKLTAIAKALKEKGISPERKEQLEDSQASLKESVKNFEKELSEISPIRESQISVPIKQESDDVEGDAF